METYAIRLTEAAWQYLGGDPDAKQPLELVVRAFDQPVRIATGENDAGPGTQSIIVPRGAGRRLVGHHFYAQPSEPGQPCRITHRGLLP